MAWASVRSRCPSMIDRKRSTDGILHGSIALAFEVLSPRQACAAFARGVGRPVRYVRGPVEIKVQIPHGYREQLQGIEVLFGQHNAPYFGPNLQAPDEAIELWEGHRGMEEYAREVFPLEEAANGMTWMN